MLLYNRFGTAIKAVLAVAIVALAAGVLMPSAYSEESGTRPSIVVFTFGETGDLFPYLAEYLGVSPFTLFKMLEYGVVSIYSVTGEIDSGNTGNSPWENSSFGDCERVGNFILCISPWGIHTCLIQEDGTWRCRSQ